MLLCECRYSSLTLCDVCDYSQSPRHCDQLITHSVCHPLSSPSEASGSAEASVRTLCLVCVSPILGHARAFHSRCVSLSHFSLSLSTCHFSLLPFLSLPHASGFGPRSRALPHLYLSLVSSPLQISPPSDTCSSAPEPLNYYGATDRD